MSSGRVERDFRPLGAPLTGLSLSVRIVLLVVGAALVPAALVGVASYMTVHRIQSDEVAGRLADRAAAAERQLTRFIEQRWLATEAIAGSRALSTGLEEWRARGADDGAEGVRERLASYLSSTRARDPLLEGLALFDAGGVLVAATQRTGVWNPEGAGSHVQASGEGLITGSGAAALVHMHHRVDNSGGRLVSTSRLESLWTLLAAAHDETPERLRVVDGRRHTLFDSDFHPATPGAALPAPIADQLLDLRVGNASYADEAAVEVVAGHRFEPSLDLGLLVEVPAMEAASFTRRWRELALAGSLATMALFALIGAAVAFHLTRPLRALQRRVRAVDLRDPSERLPVAAGDETGSLTVAFNQLLDALDKSTRRLGQLASIDELTGLHNRRHFEKRFEVELNRANRSGRPLSVLVIDLDHFGAFNDRFGRPQGDSFLRHVSSFLKTWLRATDVLSRYGGEEFAALLPDTGRETAIEIAERLRVRFAESHPRGLATDEPVTLSIGVATWEGGSTIQTDLIEAADRAVLDAKRAGRNRVRFAA